MSLEFDWDYENITHLARHNVQPHEAEEVLNGDTLDIEYRHVSKEERFREIGITTTGRFLEVVTTWRGDRIRVISAFDAARKAIEEYLKHR